MIFNRENSTRDARLVRDDDHGDEQCIHTRDRFGGARKDPDLLWPREIVHILDDCSVAVEENSPANRAGLLEGDLIISLDNTWVESVDGLHRLLTEDRIGVDTRMTVLRRYEKMDLSIRPGESKPREVPAGNG